MTPTTQQAAPPEPQTDAPAKKPRRKSGKAAKGQVGEGAGAYLSARIVGAAPIILPASLPAGLPDAARDDAPNLEQAEDTVTVGGKSRERTPFERYTVAIREMPTTERPRERLEHYGAAALSTTELLAIQLRIGTRERSAVGLAELLLSHFGGLRAVSNASLQELGKVKGIGKVKAVEIMAAVELGKRLAALSPEEKPCIRSPQDVANLLMPEMRDLKKEHLKSLLLNSKNQVLHIKTVSVGILDSSLVHPREVFQDAILASSAAIIIAHNHPSGDPTPSPEDKRVTQRLHEAGQLLGIDLLDHIVIGDQRWVSLKERGVI